MVQKVAVAKKLEIVRDVVEISLPAELLGHPALNGVQPQTLAAFNGQVTLRQLPRGAALYRYEEDATLVYFIVSGTVRTQHHNAAGETLESDWISGFGCLGVGELFAQSDVYQETARLEDPVKAYGVPRRLLAQLCATDPRLTLNLAAQLARRHEKGLDNERAALAPAFVRIAKHLQKLVQREGHEVAPELFRIRSTQDDIAAATGLNPRTVARAMKVMQQLGRLYVRRGEYLVRQPLTLAALQENGEAPAP
jgi:CRP-like cAMP-binding protein